MKKFLLLLTMCVAVTFVKAQTMKENCKDTTYKYSHDTTLVSTAIDFIVPLMHVSEDSAKIVKCGWLCQIGWSDPKISYQYFNDTSYSYDTTWKDVYTSSVTSHDTTRKKCDTTYSYDNKKQITGLIVRSFDWVQTAKPDLNFLRTINNIVIRINWSDLQPTESGELNTSYIDGALSWAANLNKQYGLNITFKLRIINGIYAPQWLKDKVGSIAISGSQSGSVEDTGTGTCTKFWSTAFMPYWSALQKKLAAIYDNNSLIAEVVNSATAVGSGEALIRAVGNAGALATNRDNYLKAGYTSAADLTAVYASINAMKVWKHTNIGMSLTPWQVISTKVTEEETTTNLISDSLSKAFGTRAVLGNNGLRTGDSKNGIDWIAGGIMYDIALHFIACRLKYGASIFYQTATDWRTAVPIADVLNQGLAFDASSIELPNTEKQISTDMTADQLEYYDDLYQDN